jgi:hypothetical protein
MRRGREGSFWKDEKTNQIIAINLGSDFCAEHEWGIKGIQGTLGIQGYSGVSFSRNRIKEILEILKLSKTKKIGIEARTMTTILPSKKLVDNLSSDGVQVSSGFGKEKKMHKMWGLALVSDWNADSFEFSRLADWYSPEKEELIGHWGENDFGFLCEDKEIVSELKEAFNRKDIAVWTGSSGAFQNGGLIIAIASRLPDDYKLEWNSKDKDSIELDKAAAETGIYEKLEAADKRFFALSPRWKDKENKKVVFWLNPYDQQNNESGWYTVEDLTDWIKGEGPIPKKKNK